MASCIRSIRIQSIDYIYVYACRISHDSHHISCTTSIFHQNIITLLMTLSLSIWHILCDLYNTLINNEINSNWMNLYILDDDYYFRLFPSSHQGRCQNLLIWRRLRHEIVDLLCISNEHKLSCFPKKYWKQTNHT
jgi:hypothetical protein